MRIENLFIPALTLLFAWAKIVGYISWSWWWVFSPVWIGLLIVGLMFVVGLIFVSRFNR